MKPAPGSFKVDLHTHCMEHSPCSRHPALSMAESALAHGMDAIAFTNHDCFMEPELLNGLRSKCPALKIYNCIEISLGMEHFIYIGPFDPQIPGWRNSGYEGLWRRTRENGGFLILAHPFRFSSDIEAPVADFPPDAVEIHSTNTGRDDEKSIAMLAASLKARTLTNSDGHAPEHVGIYSNIIEIDALPEDEADLANCLRKANISPCADLARIESHNKWVEKIEKLAARFIAADESPESFEMASGQWRGFYDRVKMGRSYKI